MTTTTTTIRIAANDLRHVLDVCHPSTDADITRFTLGAVQFAFSGKQLTCCGTDGRQLATTTFSCEAPACELLINISPLAKVGIGKTAKSVELTVEKNVATFSWQNQRGKQYSAKCELVEGRFPDWGSVVPSGAPIGISTIDPAQWCKAWKAYKDDIGFDLQLNGKVICRPVAAPQFNQIDHTGKPIDMRLDLDRLMGHLSAIAGKCTLAEYGDGKPLVVDSARCRFLLMPLNR